MKRSSLWISMLSLAAGAMLVATPAQADIVGLWHFDGNFDDSSGYGSTHSTSGGTPPFSSTTVQVGTHSVTSAEASGLLRLNFSSAAQALDESTAVGISLWIHINQDRNANNRIFSFSEDGSVGDGLRIRRTSTNSPPTERYYLDNAGLNGLGGNVSGRYITLPTGEWTHVAITADGTAAGLYVNGTQVHTTTLGASDGINLGNYVFFSALHFGAGSYSDVNWDELVLFDGPTGAAWASEMYQAGLAGNNIPEPGVAMLVGSGLMLIAAGRRRVAANA